MFPRASYLIRSKALVYTFQVHWQIACPSLFFLLLRFPARSEDSLQFIMDPTDSCQKTPGLLRLNRRPNITLTAPRGYSLGLNSCAREGGREEKMVKQTTIRNGERIPVHGHWEMGKGVSLSLSDRMRSTNVNSLFSRGENIFLLSRDVMSTTRL